MKAIMSKDLGVKQVMDYHEKQWSRGDYYGQGGQTQGQWQGRGAKLLGLGGQVQAAQLQAIAEGKHPHTGEQLVAAVNRGEKEIHRSAFDMTLAANKSLSLQNEVDPRISAMVARVNSNMLKELERFAQVRTEAGQAREATGNLVIATYGHGEARPDKKSDDIVPQLHFHNVIMNMSINKYGQTRAIDPNQLYKAQKFATEWANAEIAKGLRGIGYKVEWTKNGPEIAGYTREAIDAFSPRHNEIVARGGRKMDRGNEEKLQRATRGVKITLTKESREEISRRVVKDLNENYGIDAAGLKYETQERGPILELASEQRRELAAEAMRFAILGEHGDPGHTIERASIADARDVESHALRRGQGQIDIKDVRTELLEDIQRGSLYLAVMPSGAAAITTREMRDMEKDNIRITLEGKGNGAQIGSQGALYRYVSEFRHPDHGYAYSPDQMSVIRELGANKDQFAYLEGKPGASKTTILGGLAAYYKSGGYQVKGFGPTTAAARALKDAGIENVVTAQSLKNVETRPPGSAQKEVWIADESSQWSTRMANDLLRRAEKEGVAKLIWSGDQRQHGSVEAGRAIGQMERAAERAGVHISRLEVIRRQKDPQLREAVDLMSRGRLVEGYQRLDELGRVTDVADAAKARGWDTAELTTEQKRDLEVQTVANKYIASERKTGSALVVTSTHEDRKADNEAIRAVKLEAGEIAREGAATMILSQVDRTRAERKWAGTYEQGDRVLFNFKSRTFYIDKGESGTVIKTNPDKNTLTVTLDSGRKVTYDPRRLSGVSVCREEQRIFAVGDTIITTQANRDQGIANGDIGMVKAIGDDRKTAVVEWQAVGKQPARTTEINLIAMKGIDYGYAATSHHLQGLQTGTAIVHAPRDSKSALVGASRGVHDIQVVAEDREKLLRQVEKLEPERSAIDGVRAAATWQLSRDQERDWENRAGSMLAQYARELGLHSDNREERLTEQIEGKSRGEIGGVGNTVDRPTIDIEKTAVDSIRDVAREAAGLIREAAKDIEFKDESNDRKEDSSQQIAPVDETAKNKDHELER